MTRPKTISASHLKAAIFAVVLCGFGLGTSNADDAAKQQEALDKLLEASTSWKPVPLPQQKPFAAATGPVKKIDVIARVLEFTYDETAKIDIVAGPASAPNTLMLSAARSALKPKETPIIPFMFEKSRPLGSQPVATTISLDTLDSEFQSFVSENLAPPTTFVPDSSIEFTVTPSDNRFSQIVLRALDPGEPKRPASFSRHSEIGRTNFPGRIGITDLKLVYAEKPGSVSFSDSSNDINLVFPESGLYWMHCYGQIFDSKYVCRTGDLDEPAYLTVWVLRAQ